MSDNTVLKITNLEKNYGKHQILKSVNLEIEKGAIYGLVGKNGAGKTTLMRVITGLQNPTNGAYELWGVPYTDKNINTQRKRVGAIIENVGLYKNLTAKDNMLLQYISTGNTATNEWRELLNFVGLDPDSKKKVGKYSLGMRQRLGIAVSLVGNPDFLVLDEPINGLDPQGIIEIREILLKLNKEKMITILISSHILEELSKLVTHIAFIDDGRIIEQITRDELNSKYTKASNVTTTNVDALIKILDEMDLNYKIGENKVVTIFGEYDLTDLVVKAKNSDARITHISDTNESLEAYFMNLIKA